MFWHAVTAWIDAHQRRGGLGQPSLSLGRTSPRSIVPSRLRRAPSSVVAQGAAPRAKVTHWCMLGMCQACADTCHVGNPNSGTIWIQHSALKCRHSVQRLFAIPCCHQCTIALTLKLPNACADCVSASNTRVSPQCNAGRREKGPHVCVRRLGRARTLHHCRGASMA